MDAHLSYLRREGVTREGEKARLFGPGSDDLDAKEFAERCEDDRHHFRFVVSPEDAVEMVDLKAFTRDLMGQVGRGPRHQARLGGDRPLEHRRTHHIKLLTSRRLAIALRDAQGRRRIAMAVRSDLPLEGQISASGATWLDRQTVFQHPVALGGGGFGREVQAAIDRRADHLIDDGLAQRQGGRVIFARQLAQHSSSRSTALTRRKSCERALETHHHAIAIH